MRRLPAWLATAAIIAAGLVGCDTVSQGDKPDTVQRLRQVCMAAQPWLELATSPLAPVQVRAIAIFPSAFCAQLLSGAMPSPEPGSMVWLQDSLGRVQAAADEAGFPLPDDAQTPLK